jgi:hypothetical protein
MTGRYPKWVSNAAEDIDESRIAALKFIHFAHAGGRARTLAAYGYRNGNFVLVTMAISGVLSSEF